MAKISIAKAKAHLSALIARSGHGHERFIITRRDRPVAALVSLEDLKVIELYEERQGLAEAAGRWSDFDEVAEAMGDLETLRQRGEGRNESL